MGQGLKQAEDGFQGDGYIETSCEAKGAQQFAKETSGHVWKL